LRYSCFRWGRFLRRGSKRPGRSATREGLYGDDATNIPAVAGWDWLYGGIGIDTLPGDAGDTNYGNDGDDLIWGGWGNDWM
jgi:Ca2+-binding RTX toxin-like protein